MTLCNRINVFKPEACILCKRYIFRALLAVSLPDPSLLLSWECCNSNPPPPHNWIGARICCLLFKEGGCVLYSGRGGDCHSTSALSLGLCRSKVSSSLWAPQVYPWPWLSFSSLERIPNADHPVFPKENAITKEEGGYGGAISYLWA